MGFYARNQYFLVNTQPTGWLFRFVITMGQRAYIISLK